MNIFEQAITVIRQDIQTLGESIAINILNAPLSDSELHACKGRYAALGFLVNHVTAVMEWLKDNPEASEFPSTFLQVADEPKAPVEKPEVHTVSLDEGN